MDSKRIFLLSLLLGGCVSLKSHNREVANLNHEIDVLRQINEQLKNDNREKMLNTLKNVLEEKDKEIKNQKMKLGN